MAELILQLKDLIQLNLLHFAYLGSNFQVSHFIFTIRTVSKDVIKLDHSIFKRLDFHLLRLNSDEERVQLLHEVVDLSVQVGEAGVLSVRLGLSGVLLSVEL